MFKVPVKSGRRLMAALAVATATCTMGSGAASAGSPSTSTSSPGADKVALHDDFRFLGFCRGATGTPADTDGFAVINATKDRISATVSLKDGLPNQTYDVQLVQVPSSDGCFGKGQADLTVNKQGNGTVHVSVPRLEGTRSAWIYVERGGFFQFITEEVPID